MAIPTYRGQTIPVISLDPNWDSEPRFTMSYRTVMTESLNVTEERQPRRPRPLYNLKYETLGLSARETAYLRTIVETAEDLPVACPLWMLGCRLTVEAVATDTEVFTDSTDDCLFGVFFEYAILWERFDHWEIVELNVVGVSGATLLAGLAKSYSTKALLIPIAYGHVPRGPIQQLTDENGVWNCEFEERFLGLHDQSVPEDDVDTFDATACAVQIGGSAIEEGGDKFDCYPDDEDVQSLELAGTGLDGHWIFGGDDQELLGDSLDSYAVATPPGLLEGGTGFTGAWQFWDEDAVDIVERTIGSHVDRRFRLRATDVGRYLAIGTNWNLIRICSRQAIPDTGGNISNPSGHWYGLIKDPQANMVNGMKGGLSTVHAIGIVNTTNAWARTAGPPVTYGRNHVAFRMVGTTISTFNSVGSTVFHPISGDPANNRTPQMIEIEKGSPNFTVRQIQCFPPELVRIDYPDFILKMAMEAASIAGAANILQQWAILQGSTGTTPWQVRSYVVGIDEATNGFFDAVVLNRSTAGTDPLMEWSEVLLRIMS